MRVGCSCCCCFFFFSSRRRHTRFDCDWSSDVCSSDLGQLLRFPISWLRTEPAPARVLSVRGKVELSGGDGSASRAIQAGEQLHIGDTVQTEGESSVTLEFADASRLQLREDRKSVV